MQIPTQTFEGRGKAGIFLLFAFTLSGGCFNEIRQVIFLDFILTNEYSPIEPKRSLRGGAESGFELILDPFLNGCNVPGLLCYGREKNGGKK
jgi:hypothetical protein